MIVGGSLRETNSLLSSRGSRGEASRVYRDAYAGRIGVLPCPVKDSGHDEGSATWPSGCTTSTEGAVGLPDRRRVKNWFRAMLPPQVRVWLWECRVVLGNRRILKLGRHLAEKIRAADRRDAECWERLGTRSEWEQFRDARIEALRRALGVFQEPTGDLEPSITRTLVGDRFTIDNLVFTSRPGVVVTANLYRPATAVPKQPAVVICHSHHDPKEEEELQCMGMTLARAGCFVLIMDLLGHGERRQHPVSSAADRQDYYFRYTLGAQLQLIGESLTGWMVWDLMRGIDLLWNDAGVDRDRIVLLGAVAGGGDLAAVVGALDRRIAAVVAFNFGDTPVGHWEHTRCLARTAQDGFWPWVILAAIAPRRLVYGREFAWEPQRDDAWQRIEKIYELYGRRDSLRAVHGTGRVTSHGPDDTHCTNIGFVHRRQLYSILQEWFGIPVPENESVAEHSRHELECLTPRVRELERASFVQELAREVSEARRSARRADRAAHEPYARVAHLQRDLASLLGPMIPPTTPRIRSCVLGGRRAETISLEVEDGVLVRLHLLWPTDSGATLPPVVIGFAQEGNRRLKQERWGLITRLRHGGAAVCLVELRGVGDGRHGALYRGRRSPSAGVTAASLMLGESLVGLRTRDLRSAIAYLGKREDVDKERMALWGDSLARTNNASVELAVPFDSDPYPELGEPLGGVAALLGALFEPHIQAVYIHGGLTGYASLLHNPFFYHPTDSIIPGVLLVTDLCDLVAALAPRPLFMEALVDGCNRRSSRDQIEEIFRVARAAYKTAGQSARLRLDVEPGAVDSTAAWLLGWVTASLPGSSFAL